MNTNISLPSSIKFGSHGLTILTHINKAEFVNALQFVKQAENATLFYLADLIDYGQKNYGLEETCLALEQAKFDLPRINQASKLKAVDSHVREQYGLTSEHCYVLAQNCPEEKREHWAAISQKEGLSAHELQKSIKAGAILRKQEINHHAGTGSGVPTLASVIFHYNRWLHLTTAKLKTLPPSEIEHILTTLMPIVELCATLEKSHPNATN